MPGLFAVLHRVLGTGAHQSKDADGRCDWQWPDGILGHTHGKSPIAAGLGPGCLTRLVVGSLVTARMGLQDICGIDPYELGPVIALHARPPAQPARALKRE